MVNWGLAPRICVTRNRKVSVRLPLRCELGNTPIPSILTPRLSCQVHSQPRGAGKNHWHGTGYNDPTHPPHAVVELDLIGPWFCTNGFLWIVIRRPLFWVFGCALVQVLILTPWCWIGGLGVGGSMEELPSRISVHLVGQWVRNPPAVGKDMWSWMNSFFYKFDTESSPYTNERRSLEHAHGR